MPKSPSKTRKRTPKSERTRAVILTAAEELFSEHGYERTTVRDIAARASIDPAMVMRYFGSKDALFARTAHFDLRLPGLAGTEPSEIGAALVRHAIGLWEGDRARSGLVILLRAAASNDDAASKVRDVRAPAEKYSSTEKMRRVALRPCFALSISLRHADPILKTLETMGNEGSASLRLLRGACAGERRFA